MRRSFHSKRRRRRPRRWRGASRRLARRGRGLCSKIWGDGGVIGYAYASAHNERAAYRWSVSTAIYISRNHHRRGVGRALYTTLFALLEPSVIARPPREFRCRTRPASDCTRHLDSPRSVCIVTSATRWAVGMTSAGIRQKYSPCRHNLRNRSRFAIWSRLPDGMRQCSRG